MKLKEFLYQIQRLAGDSSGDILSTDLLLTYLTEEMLMVSAMFPVQLTLIETISGNTLVEPGLSYLSPQNIWVGDKLATRTYPSDIEQFIDNGAPAGYIYWSKVGGVVRVAPATGTARIIGQFLPPTYLVTDLESDLIPPSCVPAATEVPTLTGLPLSVVRYRALYRAAEEVGAYDRAQYYLAISEKREREVRHFYESSSTTSTGFVYGQDF